MNKLGKIEDLRTIWPHETHDFSKWLSQEDNLLLLSNTLGIDIILEDTDHDHLGKAIESELSIELEWRTATKDCRILVII